MRTLLMAAMLAAVSSAGIASEASDAAAVNAPAAQRPASGATRPTRPGVDLSNVDSRVRPQDDFYRYVNGRWLDSVAIPPDGARITPSSQLDDVIKVRLKRIVDDVTTSPSTSRDRRKIALLYASFMDEATLDTLGMRPLARDLARIERAHTVGDICSLMGSLGRVGVTSPFANSVLNDPDDPDRYALTIHQDGLGLPDRAYYLEDTPKFQLLREDYRKHIAAMLRFVGDIDADAEATQVLALEASLAKAQWSAVDSADPVKTRNRVPIKRLPGMAPGVEWLSYLNAADVTGRVDVVILAQPDYFAALGRQLQQAPAPVWRAYLRYHLLSAYAPYLDRKVANEGFRFESTELRGIQQNTARWERGLDLIENSMGEALGRIYVEQYFSPASKAKLQEMVRNVVEAFRREIDVQDWMSPSTKLRAKDKLAKLRVKVGYPDRWRDYGALEIKAGDLVGNVHRASEFEYERNVHKLGKPVDRDEWYITPQTVDAYEFPPQNEIVFPAGLMQPPFFDPQADDAANYGAIGGTIGHEMSHAFDDEGSQYDADGRLVGKPGWFTVRDQQQFDERTQGLIRQYSAVEALPGYHVNGELTLSENVADNTGIAMAYKAYQISLAGKPAPVIDGLSGDQRFFMAWTQKWRAKVRESETIRLLKSNEHAPRWVRGIVPVRNQDAFYRAFGIKEGDPMYLAPSERVKVW